MVPPGNWVVMLHNTLKGAGRASIVCLSEPLALAPGSAVSLTLEEVAENGEPRFRIPGYETRVVH